ncbi:hypothetical protein TNCV_4375721 [Trichonephila clavipes]|uniref:Uncharacterized protein n=1 Tax=Trichonephila clavipes TaxID=2585209 RepID=A0A8X6W2R2_TRICX|nr:hypothetical protein TNCV_4375721 [Trichonephila clavipes]
MSSFLVLCEGNTRNRWRDGQVCPDVDKELWRLGPDGSGVFWRVMRKSDEGGQERLLERIKKEGRERRMRRPGRENRREVGRGGERDRRERTGGRRRREERRMEKGLSPEIGVKKTMNAGGVEKGI